VSLPPFSFFPLALLPCPSQRHVIPKHPVCVSTSPDHNLIHSCWIRILAPQNIRFLAACSDFCWVMKALHCICMNRHPTHYPDPIDDLPRLQRRMQSCGTGEVLDGDGLRGSYWLSPHLRSSLLSRRAWCMLKLTTPSSSSSLFSSCCYRRHPQ
jgi:hypothetical protein